MPSHSPTNTVGHFLNPSEKLVHELAGAPFTIFTEKVNEDEEDAHRNKPKIATSINYGTLDTDLRTKVLVEVNEDYHDAQKVSHTLKSGMIEELVKCFKEENDTIRELASSAIKKVANVEKGREYIVENKIIVDVTKLFEDEVVAIRSNAYHTLINLADFMYGISSIIDYEINVIEILVNRLVLEVEEPILVLVLKLMNVLLEGGRSQSIILTTLAHPRLNEHLQSKNKVIRELAARNLGSISFNERGKEATIKAESIPLLCKMLHDEVSDCRVAATRALCSLAQLKEGKV